MRKQHKTYDVPAKKWDSTRLESEAEIMTKFGLKNKRQLWKAKSTLRGFRTTAKTLFSAEGPSAEKRKAELINKLMRYGFLSEGSAIDDILPMTVEQVLARQLQFVVKSKGLAVSPKQARQLIVHGHIAVGDAKVTRPSYIVSVDEEARVRYAPTSVVAAPNHPIRKLPKATLKNETKKALAEIQERKIAQEQKPTEAVKASETKAESKDKAKETKTKIEKKEEAKPEKAEFTDVVEKTKVKETTKEAKE